MPRAACSVRAGEDGREGARVMLNVTAKLCDRNFGAKVQICFPRGEDYDVLAAELKRCLARHAERIESLLLSGELESIFSGHQGTSAEPHGGHDSRQEVKENALHRPAPVMLHEEAAIKRAAHDIRFASSDDGGGSVASASSLKAWPESGFVTVNDIVGYWNIGTSSFRNRVRSGVFSHAVDCPDRSPNAPKVWDAAVIGRELAANGYVRRGL